MKYKVASTANAMEYRFKGLDSPFSEGECPKVLTLDVNPKAGLSKARTLELVTSANSFKTRWNRVSGFLGCREQSEGGVESGF
ncbi:hypothetical protein ACFX14_002714 [Malus domestica]